MFKETERDGDCQSQAIQLAQRIAAAALYACVCVLTKETRLSLVMLLITSATLVSTEIQLASAKHVLNFSTLLSECAH